MYRKGTYVSRHDNFNMTTVYNESWIKVPIDYRESIMLLLYLIGGKYYKSYNLDYYKLPGKVKDFVQ